MQALPPEPPQAAAIIVTGKALPEPRADRVYAVERIDRRQIDQSPSHELDQLLKDWRGRPRHPAGPRRPARRQGRLAFQCAVPDDPEPCDRRRLGGSRGIDDAALPQRMEVDYVRVGRGR